MHCEIVLVMLDTLLSLSLSTTRISTVLMGMLIKIMAASRNTHPMHMNMINAFSDTPLLTRIQYAEVRAIIKTPIIPSTLAVLLPHFSLCLPALRITEETSALTPISMLNTDDHISGVSTSSKR